MIDRRDFADVTTRAQAGALQSFWPIVIPTKGIALLAEIEININPCDAIWMPTVYDVSIGTNPAQPFGVAPGEQFPFPGQAPYYLPDPTQRGSNYVAIVGANIPDVYQNGQLVQSAPVFSIRINSPNNPWLLFGLSTQIPAKWASTASSGAPNLSAGQGGCMRSITGPISRLWVKFYRFAAWVTLPTTPAGGGVIPIGPDPDVNGFSTVVLLSSLGFMQQTIEAVRTWDLNNEAGGAGALMAAYSQTIASGGYAIPQLNSADKIFLGVRE